MNQIISDYIVVTVTMENRGIFAKPIDEFTFSKLINEKIKEGYQPYGDFKSVVTQKRQMFRTTSTVILSQAMVKYQNQ